MFAARQTAGVSCVLVLLIAEHAGKTRLAATGVRVGVDWKAGAMNTPEDEEGSDRKDKDVDRYIVTPSHTHSHRGTQTTCIKYSLVAITGVVDLLVTW